MKKKNSTIEYLERDIPDSEIDTSDIPPLGEEFWANATVRPQRVKKTISIRIDPDILDYFKGQGKGYQSKINSVLRTYVDHQKRTQA